MDLCAHMYMRLFLVIPRISGLVGLGLLLFVLHFSCLESTLKVNKSELSGTHKFSD